MVLVCHKKDYNFDILDTYKEQHITLYMQATKYVRKLMGRMRKERNGAKDEKE